MKIFENKKHQFVAWLVFSIILSLILAKYSKGLCVYLFISFSWIFIWTLFSQAHEFDEKTKEEIAYCLFASFLGWGIGTFFIWKSRNIRNGFFQQ